MAVAPFLSSTHDFKTSLDELLLDICEDIQLSATRHDQAVQRYETLGDALESEGSPFRSLGPKIYPQGSMALGTTVKPTEGPHDLDFVLELSLLHQQVDPMRLIQELYTFLRKHGVYGPMTSLKNRCVRVEYANEFYMDILPACRNGDAGGTCIKVPDRALNSWTDSDPLGYIRWFEERASMRFVARIFDKAVPVPAQEPVVQKKPLKLVVQLIKRWRDRYYTDADLAPISIVLTTLAGHAYTGERSVSESLNLALNRIVGFIDSAHQTRRRLRVWHPTHPAEELSERWNNDPAAYQAFEKGIRAFRERWSLLMTRNENVNLELEALFGEPVKAVLRKRAEQLQKSRLAGQLGVSSAGIISRNDPSVIPARPNTFYGEQ
jgi:hypothetical protein